MLLKLDPLLKLKEAERRGIISKNIVKRIEKRMKYLYEGINRIENSSKLPFPSFYIEPYLPLVISTTEIGKMGVIYARVIPIVFDTNLNLYIEISAPLILFGSKNTICAVLAHEFSHYIFLLWKLSKFNILSEESSSTLFESLYKDEERLIKPERLYKDRGLVRLVKNRFKNGFVDIKLEDKTFKGWIEKNLPVQRLSPETNIIRIPIKTLLNLKIDSKMRKRIDEIFRAL
ncbi:hypothetical protein HRbin06_00133 [archaeon HR06]|nr:hypothetical protein HRbin06_00133 [archaeon HR06]